MQPQRSTQDMLMTLQEQQVPGDVAVTTTICFPQNILFRSQLETLNTNSSIIKSLNDILLQTFFFLMVKALRSVH